MTHQPIMQNVDSLEKLVRLYELRQSKARKAYQEQKKSLQQKKQTFELREKEHLAVIGDTALLNNLARSEKHASDLHMQQHITLKRDWLKYDFGKTKYFLNDARFDLNVEQKKAAELKATWMELRIKNEHYEAQLLKARRTQSLTRDSIDESEIEEDSQSHTMIVAGCASSRQNTPTRRSSSSARRQHG